MKLRTILVAAILTAAPALIAQSPAPSPAIPPAQQASREDILQLFHVLHIDKQMAQMQQILIAQMEQQFQRMTANMTDDQKAKFHDAMEGVKDIYPVSEMLDDLVPVYQHNISADDAHAIVAFYQSPAGQHLINGMPAMMQEGMAALTPKMTERLQTYQANLMKQVKDAAPPAQQTPPTAVTK